MVEVPFTSVCPFCGQEHTDTIEVPIEDYVDEDGEAHDYPTNEEGEPLCTGMDDGQCSRTVDEPGATCWQHPND